jgi:uncharacterized membrane protein YtjA (UPF0391 family)
MLYWLLLFVIVATLAAIFGFGGPAVAVPGTVKVLLFIALAVFIMTLITGMTRRSSTRM